MLLRLIFLILIFIYHKQIYDFLSKNNLTSIKGIQNKIKKVEKVIQRNELDNTLIKLKELDKKIYKEVVLRIHNIDTIIKNIDKDNNISLRNEYQNIKYERKKILNSISSIVVSRGINNSYLNFINVIDKYIFYKIKKIDEIRIMKGYDSEWFEDFEFDNKKFDLEAFDPNIDHNYDIF